MNGRQLWLDPSFGASGDMILGALFGLGVPLAAVIADLDGLAVEGWSVAVKPTMRSGLASTRALVTASDDAEHRAWSTIDGLLADSSLPSDVSNGARRTFELLARVEAGIHQVDVDEVQFHEVGAIDAIIDIVGAWSALRHLDVDRVHAAPVGLGQGTVEAAHGTLPAPAPATLDLLRGLPVRAVATTSETVTPTGAALLATMVDEWGPIPAGRLGTASRGAGGRDPATHPNVLGAVLITVAERQVATRRQPATDGTEHRGESTSDAVVLATNLDDVTAEVIGRTIDRLLEAGADDAWAVPVVMKKNRPGHELRVLSSPQLAPLLRALLFEETGTLGIRTGTVWKHRLERSTRAVTVRGVTIRIKVGPYGAKPEYEDLVAASDATGVPIRLLANEAIRADSSPESDVRHYLGPQLSE